MRNPLESQNAAAAYDPSALAVPSSPHTALPLLEEGAVFESRQRRNGAGGEDSESFQAIVIGGGQAGLSVGHHLARLGVTPFVILEAHPRIGDAWRQRWDSLRLFTPARFDGLDGLKFPAAPDYFPTKDEMADYLEHYAGHFRLPIRTSTRVTKLSREGDGYVVMADGRRFEAPHVVIAMSTYQRPRVPDFAPEMDPSIVQMHSVDYRRPDQLPPGDVLVVGAANSGAEISLDLKRSGRRVWLAGRHPGQVPFRVHRRIATRLFMPILFRIVFHRILTVDTPIGRKARPKFMVGGLPLVRTKLSDLVAAGIPRVARVEGARHGKPRLADGTVLDVTSIMWSTGYDIGCDWLDLPVFDGRREPTQSRGAVPGEPGLYFVGPHFTYSVSSTMIHGVGRDARRVAETIAARKRAAIGAA
jgi:putative flavoprotein involved in K+ transport